MKKFYWAIGAIVSLGLIYFVFIPAFAGRLVINPIIQLGPIQIRWYGIVLAFSIFTAYLVIRKQSWKFGISEADVDDYSFWAIITAVIGARIYYVLFNWAYFSQNLFETYKIWHGGISIYGGVIAAIIFTYFYTRHKAYSFWQMADLVVLGLPLGQALGRLGNFFNQEAFGTPTNLPWKMFVSPANRPAQFANYDYFHPAFLYEMLADLFVFVLLYKLFGKVKSGSLFFIYLLAYSFFRFFIEGIRLDSLYLGGFRVDQIIAIIIVFVSATLLYLSEMKVQKH